MNRIPILLGMMICAVIGINLEWFSKDAAKPYLFGAAIAFCVHYLFNLEAKDS